MDESTRKLFEQADARLELMGFDSVEKIIICSLLVQLGMGIGWLLKASDKDINEWFESINF